MKGKEKDEYLLEILIKKKENLNYSLIKSLDINQYLVMEILEMRVEDVKEKKEGDTKKKSLFEVLIKKKIQLIFIY